MKEGFKEEKSDRILPQPKINRSYVSWTRAALIGDQSIVKTQYCDMTTYTLSVASERLDKQEGRY
jgi:hypothetical protein